MPDQTTIGGPQDNPPPYTGGEPDLYFGHGDPPWMPDPTQNYAPGPNPGSYGDYVGPSENPPPDAAHPVPPAVPTPQLPGPVYTDTGWSGYPGGSVLASIWGRKRYVESRFAKDAIRLARKVGLEAIRGAVDYFRAPPAGPPPESSARAVVPFMERAGMGMLGALGIFAADVGFAMSDLNPFVFVKPLARMTNMARLGSGELPKRGLVSVDPRVQISNDIWRSQQQLDRDTRAVTRPIDLLPTGQYPLGFPIDEIPAPQIARRRGGGLEAAIEDSMPAALRAAIENMRAGRPGGRLTTPQPVNAGPPAPASMGSTAYGTIPSSPPASSTTTNKSLPRPNVRWGAIGIGLGSIIAANVFLPRLIGSGGGSAALNSPGPIAPGVPATGTPPIPSIQTVALYGGSTAIGGGGYCTPRPRGPTRKCLERAPVAWRGGRNKGKAAGSKCVRFAQRAT